MFLLLGVGEVILGPFCAASSNGGFDYIWGSFVVPPFFQQIFRKIYRSLARALRGLLSFFQLSRNIFRLSIRALRGLLLLPLGFSKYFSTFYQGPSWATPILPGPNS